MGNDTNSIHNEEDGDATKWIAMLMANLLAQMESWFEYKLDEHKIENEREDDVKFIRSIDEENLLPMV